MADQPHVADHLMGGVVGEQVVLKVETVNHRDYGWGHRLAGGELDNVQGVAFVPRQPGCQPMGESRYQTCVVGRGPWGSLLGSRPFRDGQRGVEVRRQLGTFSVVGGGDEQGDLPVPGDLGAGGVSDRDCLGHTFTAQSRRFDLTQFDAMTTHLHLGVEATQEFDLPLRQPAPAVAGEVPAGPGPFDETGGSRLRVVLVAAGQRTTCYDDVPRHQIGAGAPIGVDHVHCLTGQRHAVGNRGTVLVPGGHDMEVRPDTGLGGTSQGDDRHRRVVFPQPGPEVDRDPVAGDQDQPQTGQGPRGSGVADHRGLGGGRVPEGDAVGRHQIGPHTRVGVVRGSWDDQRAAEGENPEDVEHREIETQRRDHQPTILVTDVPAVPDVHDGVQGGTVGHHDPLRVASGTRGEDHVGIRIRIIRDTDLRRITGLRDGFQDVSIQHHPGPAAGDHTFPAGPWMGDVHGNVTATGGHDAEDGGHLPGPAWQTDDHPVACGNSLP